MSEVDNALLIDSVILNLYVALQIRFQFFLKFADIFRHL
jgi:hypothetical protein